MALGVNTVLSVYGVLIGGSAAWGVCVVSGSLLSWNATLFLQRWPNAPLSSQNRYLRCIAAVTGLGLGAGLSALALQGRLYLPFGAAFLLMLTAAVLLLRLITHALKTIVGVVNDRQEGPPTAAPAHGADQRGPVFRRFSPMKSVAEGTAQHLRCRATLSTNSMWRDRSLIFPRDTSSIR
ncbi:MAG: hypothetical protein M0C28_37435 [Candidatus Moduliflexus flocculans]|nr:hypothetical protein [Candidatus Moduliflexus flocculans]